MEEQQEGPIEAQELETKYRVCIGKRKGHGGKVWQFWQDVVISTDYRTSGGWQVTGSFPTCIPSRKGQVAGAVPGAIYKFAFTADGQIYVAGQYGPEFVGMYPDEAQVTRWAVKTKATERAETVAKYAKKETNVDYIQKALTPITGVMLRATRAERAAIKILVMEYLDRFGG